VDNKSDELPVAAWSTLCLEVGLDEAQSLVDVRPGLREQFSGVHGAQIVGLIDRLPRRNWFRGVASDGAGNGIGGFAVRAEV
jgi:hypothetical protein